MPAIDRGWPDEYQRFSPPGPQPPQEQAKQTISGAETSIRPSENTELVAEGKHLEQEISTRRQPRSERSDCPEGSSHRLYTADQRRQRQSFSIGRNIGE